MAILLPILNSCAQSSTGTNPPNIKPLQVGDTIPHIILTDVINFPVSQIKLDNSSNKLVILDFWATWCNSCIKKLPLVDSLQKEFNNNLQIILVNSISGTGDTKEKIKNFYAQKVVPKINAFSVPIVMEDTLLRKIFPHEYVPHYVWIGPGNKLLGITSAQGFTRTNIQAALKGGTVIFESIEQPIVKTSQSTNR